MLKEKMIKEAIENVFKFYSKEDVEAIYLTGSALNNLMVEGSDIDLYVVLKQNKLNLIMCELLSGQEHGEEQDFKYMESFKFLQLLAKTNPNALELLFKKPIYVSESFKKVSEYLYEHKLEVIAINKERYFSSGYSMMKTNFTKLLNGSGRVATGKAGKEVLNFYKTYYQLKAYHEGKSLEKFVVFEGTLKEELLEYKTTKAYSKVEKEILLEKMEKELSEIEKIKEEYIGKPFEISILSKVVEKL